MVMELSLDNRFFILYIPTHAAEQRIGYGRLCVVHPTDIPEPITTALVSTTPYMYLPLFHFASLLKRLAPGKLTLYPTVIPRMTPFSGLFSVPSLMQMRGKARHSRGGLCEGGLAVLYQ